MATLESPSAPTMDDVYARVREIEARTGVHIQARWYESSPEYHMHVLDEMEERLVRGPDERTLEELLRSMARTEEETRRLLDYPEE
ncbi:MAG TPA: hypothetical protein VI913_02555 [Candidatus Peribacteraceae bacterium]|nr:hypothetical protein [Candidatus Peribacteraceae bacterium]